MPELLIDFITSLDGYGAADGWPGWWGLEGPEYLAWLGEQPEADYTVLMGATTYRVMSGLAAEGEPGTDALAGLSKVVFSTTLREPLSWPNTQLIARDAVEAVRDMKDKGSRSMRTMGSLTLCRSLLKAGLVDRFRVVIFPVITGSQRSGAHLRRLSRCCARHDQQPDLRRSHPAGRVRSDSSGRAAWHHQGQRLTGTTWRSEPPADSTVR